MIRVARDGAVATLLLDRPAARNAIPVDGWCAIADAARDIAQSDAAVAVLRSAVPDIFSAGADLAGLARLADHVEERAPFRLAMRAGIDALAALPMPLVASVSDSCHGAGVALVLAADIVVAGPDAAFAIPPARLGIGYPAEDVARLVARVGRGQASRLLFGAAPVEATEALRIGLADVAGDGAAVATGIAANDPAALRLLKRVVDDPANPVHAAAFDDRFGSPAFREGTARFRS